jgi:hypothetical protein
MGFWSGKMLVEGNLFTLWSEKESENEGKRKRERKVWIVEIQY